MIIAAKQPLGRQYFTWLSVEYTNLSAIRQLRTTQWLRFGTGPIKTVNERVQGMEAARLHETA